MSGVASDGAVLHLVVGPSGVGKDTLIDAAREARPDIVFPTRVITRRGGAVGEAHQAVDWDRFAELEADGAFFLKWRAHDLAYGVPHDVLETLAANRHVLVNVSRRVLDDARAAWPHVRVLWLTAPIEVLAARLAERGRESEADIAARLARAQDVEPSGDDAWIVQNAGNLEDAKAAFLDALAPPITAESR